MLKKVMPLVAVILLSACAHGMSGTCTHCAGKTCQCAAGACACGEKCSCPDCAAKKAEKEKMGGDCPKCREAERYLENKRYND